MAPSVVGQRNQLGPPLAQAEEEREQEHEQQEPVAERDVDGDRAAVRTQHEAAGEHNHVQDHDVLQRERVQRE